MASILKSVVLIPCFKRPEFLAVCLEYILKAELSETYKYVFLLDYGYDKAIKNVIETFPLDKEIRQTKRTYYTLGKQSHNLLEGYKYACEITDGLVYLIEDDIMIANDFFKWHELAQQSINFCTIATANNNTKRPNGTDLTAYYKGTKADYQSLGVCWQSKVLKKYILQHANDRYYSNPVLYCERFKDSSIGKFFAEQDGLIRRIKETTNLPVLFADVPRAFHGGFIGYNRNRGKKLKGTLEQRISFIREVMQSPELMKQQVEKPEFYEDSKPVNLVNPIWQSENLRHTNL